jgi:hypothetical protein
MLLILATAFFSTIGFYRQAQRVGVHPGKAASVPFIAAMLMIIFAYLAGMLVEGWILQYEDLVKTAEWFQSAVNLTVVLTYLFFIKRNWLMLHQPVDSANQAE